MNILVHIFKQKWNGTNFARLHYTESHIKALTSWAVELQLSFALVCVSRDEWTMIYSWDGGSSDTWTISCLGVWNRHLTKMSQESYQSCGLIMKWFLVTHCALFLWSFNQNHAWIHPGKLSACFLNSSLTPLRIQVRIFLSVFSSVWSTQKVLSKWNFRTPHTMWNFWRKEKVTK